MSRSKPRRERASDSKETRLLRTIALAGVYGGLLMPLVIPVGLVAYPFVLPKILFFQVLMSLTVPAFLVLAWREPRYRPRFSWIYAALGGHLAALALSAATAADQHRTFWGSQERMNGLLQLLHFAAWLAMASSLLKTWPDWRKLLHWQAVLGFVVALVALLQRPFPNLLGVAAESRVAGLLGHPIYLGAYQAFMVFWLALLWSRADKPAQRRCYAVGIGVCALAMLASGSRGPLLGLVAGAAFAFAVWVVGDRRCRVVAFGGAALVCIVATYFLVARYFVPLGSLEEFWSRNRALQHLFQAEFDPVRRHLWAIAWNAFRDRPWLGWGLANFDIVFDTYFDPWFTCLGPNDRYEDSSHSLYLDHLSTAGILGLATFLVLWGSALSALRGALRARHLELPASAILSGMIASHLTQGAFVFDSLGVHSMTHLLLALAVAAGGSEWGATKQSNRPNRPRAAPPMAASRIAIPLFLVVEVAGLLLAFRTSILPGYASYTTMEVNSAFESGNCRTALALLGEVARVPTPYLEDQMFILSKNLGAMAKKGWLGRCPGWRSMLDHGRGLMRSMLEWRPEHCRQRWGWANLLVMVGQATGEAKILAEAGPELEAVLAENPRRQEVRYRYMDWLAEVGRLGEAKAHLDLASSQDDMTGEAQWRRGVFLWRHHQQEREGAELMAKAIENKCQYWFRSAIEVQQLARAYVALGDRVHLKGMVRSVEDFSKGDRPIAVHLGIARYLDDLGLTAERDRVLEIARDRDSALAERLRPWLEGRSSLGELESLYGKRAESTASGQGVSSAGNAPPDRSSSGAKAPRPLADEAATR